MSVIREIKINYDLSKIKTICQELGLYVQDKVSIKEIIGNIQEKDTILDFAVAKNPSQKKFNLGFLQKNDNTYIYVDKYYKENDLLMQEIVTKYIIDGVYPFYSLSEMKTYSKREVVLVFTK